MADTFEMQSMDVSWIPRAPNIEFQLKADDLIVATPPGGSISIIKLDDGEARVRLVNELTGEFFADVLVRQVSAPSVGPEWNEETLYMCEVAAALYWSMWRMQQIKAAQAAQPQEAAHV